MIVGILAVDRLRYVKSPDLVDGGEASAGLTAGLHEGAGVAKPITRAPP